MVAVIGAIAGQANAVSLESECEWGCSMPSFGRRSYGGYGGHSHSHSHSHFPSVSYGPSHGSIYTSSKSAAVSALEAKLAQQMADLAALKVKAAKIEADKKAAEEAAEKERQEAEEKAKKEAEEKAKKEAEEECKRIAAEKARKAYEAKIYNSSFYKGYGSSIFDHETDNVCVDNNHDGICDSPGDEGCTLDLDHDGVADCEDKDCDADSDTPEHTHDPHHIDDYIYKPRRVSPYYYGARMSYLDDDRYSPYGARSYGGLSRYGSAGGYGRDYGVSSYGRAGYSSGLYGAGYGRTASPSVSSSYSRYGSRVQKPSSSVYKRSASYASPYGERVNEARGYYTSDSSRGMYGTRSYETKRAPSHMDDRRSLNW